MAYGLPDEEKLTPQEQSLENQEKIISELDSLGKVSCLGKFISVGLLVIAAGASVRSCNFIDSIYHSGRNVGVSNPPYLHVENIRGNPNIPEEFYVVDGKKVFRSVDNRPASEYFPK